MAVDVAPITSAITENLVAAVSVGLSLYCAIWTIRAVKLITSGEGDSGPDPDRISEGGYGEPCSHCGADSEMFLDGHPWCGDDDCEYNMLCRRCGDNYVGDTDFRVCDECAGDGDDV